MTLTSGLFSSNTDEWSTPSELFNQLNEEFNFTLDVCATSDNAKCKDYFTKEQDGLSQKWHGTVWMNPPYGRAIAKWIEKAHEYGTTGGTAVALIPARTDTRYWHDFVMDATEIRFIKGRVRFGDSDAGAPFPSAIVVFSPKRHPRVSDYIVRDSE